MAEGFGVDADQLRRVARRYDGESVDLAALAGTVGTDIGAAHLGRGFAAVAGPYRQAFERFGRSVAEFGEHTGRIAGWLTTMAASYTDTEEELTRSITLAETSE